MLFKWGCFLVSEKFVSGVLKYDILPLIFEYHPVLCTRASYKVKRVTRGEDFKETKLQQLMLQTYVMFDATFFRSFSFECCIQMQTAQATSSQAHNTGA